MAAAVAAAASAPADAAGRVRDGCRRLWMWSLPCVGEAALGHMKSSKIVSGVAR